MKVNLAMDESQFIDGYQNHIITPELLEQIPDATCTEILLIDSLDYIPTETLPVVIGKLRHGGTIQIVSTDLLEICRSIFLGLLPMEECNTHLTNGRLKLIPLIQIKQQLESLGLQIVEMSMKNIKYDIKAQRP
tara:strand:- start:3382 stop:3783 length:402 start_codon:yes stop_codon:yes gene_type:complete